MIFHEVGHDCPAGVEADCSGLTIDDEVFGGGSWLSCSSNIRSTRTKVVHMLRNSCKNNKNKKIFHYDE
jgi:hypothetical protein